MANRTQKAITGEFETMLKEMPFSKITVSALAARCEISANTFYYHYRDIYDLLDEWLEQKKELLLKDTEGLPDWDSLLKKFLHALKANQRLVYHIADSISRERLERYVFITVKGQFLYYLTKSEAGNVLDEDSLRGLADFCCYSVLGITLEFIWEKMEDDPDELVTRIRRTLDGVVEYFILHPEH